MSTIAFAPAFDTSDVRQPRNARPLLRTVPQSSDRTVRRTTVGSTVRLTRRGRLVLFLGTLALMLAGGVFFGAGAVGTEKAGTPEPSTIVTVGPGDTLWGIAAEASEGGDVRDVMTEIEQLNALETPVLQAGQRIRVPLAD
ncbi:MAG TPA: LysM peptidoglycan-binding domain-containing protein [Nocardioides sp.]